MVFGEADKEFTLWQEQEALRDRKRRGYMTETGGAA
jgi:hypothetical protein